MDSKKQIKICTYCNLEKEINNYGIDIKGKHGVKSVCKACKYIQHKNYIKNNPTKIKETNKKYLDSDPNKIKNIIEFGLRSEVRLP